MLSCFHADLILEFADNIYQIIQQITEIIHPKAIHIIRISVSTFFCVNLRALEVFLEQIYFTYLNTMKIIITTIIMIPHVIKSRTSFK